MRSSVSLAPAYGSGWVFLRTPGVAGSAANPRRPLTGTSYALWERPLLPTIRRLSSLLECKTTVKPVHGSVLVLPKFLYSRIIACIENGKAGRTLLVCSNRLEAALLITHSCIDDPSDDP